MEVASYPRHLVMDDRGLNFAGQGRSPGALAYVSPATGEVVDVFFGKVVTLEASHAILAVGNNQGIPPVRADTSQFPTQPPLKLGGIYLLSVRFTANGPVAKSIWPTDKQRPSKPTIEARKLGVIRKVMQGYGFILPEDGTREVFYHVSSLEGFSPVVGMPVTYTPKTDVKGPQAVQVRRHHQA